MLCHLTLKIAKIAEHNVGKKGRNILSRNAVILVGAADTAAAVASTFLTYSADHTLPMHPAMCAYIPQFTALITINTQQPTAASQM